MPDLSPATSAIVAAFDARYELCGPFDANWQELCLAAALRAAADQVVPDDYDPPRGVSYPEKDAFVDGKCVRNEDIRVTLLAIAAELDGDHG